MSRCIGFPIFGKSYPLKVLERSLTSANKIPNPDGAAIGSLVEFHPTKGVRSTPSTTAGDWAGEYTNHRIYYDGPYGTKPTTAWSPYDAALARDLGVTFSFEIERAMFDATDQATWMTGASSDITPIALHGATNNGFLSFGPSAVASDTTWESQINVTYTGVTAKGCKLSKYANDKAYVPVVVSLRRGYMDIWIDGFHAISTGRTASPVATAFDDMYLCGKLYNDAGNISPAGFPYWMRNLQVLAQPVIYTPDQYGRIVFLGDSVVAQGDYYTNSSPRYDAGHPGSAVDAGMTPMVERLMHRDGIFTSDLWNVGKGGARMKYVATQYALIDQVNGNNVGTAFDGKPAKATIAIVHAGVNDALLEVSTAADIKIAARAAIEYMLSGRFKHIVLCNVFDASGSTVASNSASVIATRTAAINVAYAELAEEFSNVYLCDIHTPMGGTTQNASLFRADLTHPIEEGQAIIGRAIYAVLSANVFNK